MSEPKKYKITVGCTTRKDFEVEADNPVDASVKAQQLAASYFERFNHIDEAHADFFISFLRQGYPTHEGWG